FGEVAAPSAGGSEGATPSKAVPLPKILSVLTRQARDIGNGMPHQYHRDLGQLADLVQIAAVVCSSNWESEIADEGLVGRPDERSEEEGQLGEEAQDQSVVMIDSETSLESAWEKAVAGK